MVEGFVSSSLLTAHLFVTTTMANLWRLWVHRLLVWRLAASKLVGFQFVFCRLTVSVLMVGGSMVFLCGDRFPIAGSPAAGFQALGLTRSKSEAAWFKQRQVHRNDAAEPTSFTATPEHNAAEPDVGEAAGLYSAISGRHNNQPF